jgi:probable H4MPT-linked C1 transfer pathway protein
VVRAAFPNADIRVFTTDGRFVTVDAAREDPIAVAAANWTATACVVAQRYRTALLIDVGTTTTDIIPIVDGHVVTVGKTDPDRLASGELVYTGALRTPVEAIVRDVPYRDGRASVSAEAFALIGDVHLWRGRFAADDYTVPTPDGRGVTRAFAGERIARVICADSELLDESAVTRIADSVAAEQIAIIAAAIQRARSRHPSIQAAVVTGLGEFIARDAARAAGLDVVSLADDLGVDASRYAPAAAVALRCAESPWRGPYQARPTSVDLVIKVGGGLLEHVEQLDRVLSAIVMAARQQHVIVVPGGGPFADAVRDADERLGLGDDAAHWMAILGMDQYAHLLASRLSGAVVVSTREEIDPVLRQRQIPVLAPSRWLSSVDPLPHTWDVTSDSIAAWVAGELGADRLLLVKPPGVNGADLVDAYFERALPPPAVYHCLAADEAIQLLTQIAGIVNPAGPTEIFDPSMSTSPVR